MSSPGLRGVLPFDKVAFRVLMVDDEAVVRFTVSTHLRAHNFNVRAVATVSEALALIQSKKFDVFICDLNIAGRHDGLKVIEAMQLKQPKCHTFILTATPDVESLLWAIRHKVDDYFLKLSDEGALGDRLKEHLTATRFVKSKTLADAPPTEAALTNQQSPRPHLEYHRVHLVPTRPHLEGSASPLTERKQPADPKSSLELPNTAVPKRRVFSKSVPI